MSVPRTTEILALLGLVYACNPESPSPRGSATDSKPTTSAVPSAPQPTATSSAQPAEPRLGDAEDLALGTAVDCALRKDHTVWCWGSDRVAKPSPITKAKHVAVVESYACVIADSGEIQCALAAGGKVIPVPLYRDGVTIAGHDDGYCVDTEDGVLRCGLQDRENKTVKPPSGMPGLKHATAYAIGQDMGFALLAQDLWAWNNQGGAGIPRTLSSIADARGVAVGRQQACVYTTAGDLWCLPAALEGKPKTVEGYREIQALSIGYGANVPDWLCLLKKDGSVWCSELAGEGAEAAWGTPKQVEGVTKAVELGTGTSEDRCARTEKGEVFCWDRQLKVAPVLVAAK